MHVAYPIPGGFAVAEVWEGKAQQETWYNKFVTPNLPDPDAMSAEYFEIHAIGQPLDDHPENRNKPWLLAKHPANHQVSECSTEQECNLPLAVNVSD